MEDVARKEDLFVADSMKPRRFFSQAASMLRSDFAGQTKRSRSEALPSVLAGGNLEARCHEHSHSDSHSPAHLRRGGLAAVKLSFEGVAHRRDELDGVVSGVSTMRTILMARGRSQQMQCSAPLRVSRAVLLRKQAER